ncbi:zinc finger protein CONSTANS-LIKE 2-like [Cornus florida]|uniref:zinc finger protein CONSTANS-LIKE 2-like n=1 Tax=Cornus florida TaxID=4283 RepID=UPI00289ADBCB|nr:zinc finger protein CONSTANS-LIKE 2-like [Cornus florida]
MMLKEECVSVDGVSNNWARVCDLCRFASSSVYCLADSAYLCTWCDARVHVESHHKRVRVCAACERAPAAVLCKADAASLCTVCDKDIHSANPLAHRHHRVPVQPISGCLFGPPATDGSATNDLDCSFLAEETEETIDEEDEDEAASWLLLNPIKNNHRYQNNSGSLFGDQYLDLVDYNPCQDNQFSDRYIDQQQQYSVPQKSYGGDRVVPVQCGDQGKNQPQIHTSFQFGMDYDQTSKSASTYHTSIGHSVSPSSMDVGVVPEPEPTMSDVSISHPRPSKGTIDLFTNTPTQMPPQNTPMDREARVLRYREKKKMRKFEKTIRYASRKAYAETRPRIKGRFAKRTNVEVEEEQMLSTTLMVEHGYGIVPSF